MEELLELKEWLTQGIDTLEATFWTFSVFYLTFVLFLPYPHSPTPKICLI
ncbi:hypothetical protein A5482_009240 [Cyanobacterium sp. IPPAS B-1200]|nr:hypothetical protein [Cyanobacterium sp. IPPAS B-1200]